MSGSLSIIALRRRAIASVTFFSRVPPRPCAPGSSPPCPASIATITSRSRRGTFSATTSPRSAFAPFAAAASFDASFEGSFALSFATSVASFAAAAPRATSPIASGFGATSASSGSAGFAG